MKKRISTILAVLVSIFMFLTNINIDMKAQAATEEETTRTNGFGKKIKYGDTVNNNTVVILIKFKGQPDSVYSKSEINTIKGVYVNDQKNYKDLLYQISNGKFITNVCFPFDKEYSSDKATPFIYEAEHPISYYMPYSSKNKTGYKTISDFRERILLFNKAFAAIKDRIPKDVDLDTDKDGQFDNVHFIIPSNPQNQLFTTSAISCTYDADNITEINGAKLTCFELLTLPQIQKSKCAVPAHECLHLQYFFPDMYTSNESPIKNCCNYWTIMTKSTSFPTVYERMIYSKWVDEKDVPVISKTDTYTLQNSTKDPSENTIAYRINIPGSKEYFMVEYRDNNASIYEDHIPSKGILVYRVNSDRIDEGNMGDKPELVVLQNEGVDPSQSALNGKNNRKELSLKLESGEDTGYKIEYVKSGYGEATFKLINNSIKAPEVSSITTDLSSPQYIGNEVTLTAKTLNEISSNNNTHTFKIVKESSDDKEELINAENSENGYTAKWIPKESGNYKITFTCKDELGQTSSKEISYSVLEESQNKATIYLKDNSTPFIIYKLNGEKANIQCSNITLDNTLDGYKYKTEIDLKDKDLATVHFNTGDLCTDLFSPKSFKVLNGYYTYENGTLTKIKNEDDKLSINKLTLNSAYGKPNDEFTISANSIYNNGSVKYKFTATNKETNETILLQDFSENSICSASLKDIGSYKINVEAMDDSHIVVKSIDYKVVEKENNVVIYYKGLEDPYVCYKINDNLWSGFPGEKLEKCDELDGYTHKVEIELGDEESLEAIFNNGELNFDDDSLKKYKLTPGNYTYKDGIIDTINN